MYCSIVKIELSLINSLTSLLFLFYFLSLTCLVFTTYQSRFLPLTSLLFTTYQSRFLPLTSLVFYHLLVYFFFSIFYHLLVYFLSLTCLFFTTYQSSFYHLLVQFFITYQSSFSFFSDFQKKMKKKQHVHPTKH